MTIVKITHESQIQQLYQVGMSQPLRVGDKVELLEIEYPPGRGAESAIQCLDGPKEQRRQDLRRLVDECRAHLKSPWAEVPGFDHRPAQALLREAEQLLAEGDLDV